MRFLTSEVPLYKISSRFSHLVGRCRVNLEPIRQSRPDHGLDLSHFQCESLHARASCPFPVCKRFQCTGVLSVTKLGTRKADVRLPGKGNLISHDARPVHLIITTKTWILTSEYKYRGTSLIRNSAPLRPYGRTMPRALWWPRGRVLFLMSEVPL